MCKVLSLSGKEKKEKVGQLHLRFERCFLPYGELDAQEQNKNATIKITNPNFLFLILLKFYFISKFAFLYFLCFFCLRLGQFFVHLDKMYSKYDLLVATRFSLLVNNYFMCRDIVISLDCDEIKSRFKIL